MVDHRQRAGQTQRHRVDVGVRLIPEAVGGTREHLGGGCQLGVHLEAAHQLPSGTVGSLDDEHVIAVGHGDRISERIGGHPAFNRTVSDGA